MSTINKPLLAGQDALFALGIARDQLRGLHATLRLVTRAIETEGLQGSAVAADALQVLKLHTDLVSGWANDAGVEYETIDVRLRELAAPESSL